MKPQPDKRLNCPKCCTVTWSTDYTKFMQDHARPDGRICQNTIRIEAQKLQSVKP